MGKLISLSESEIQVVKKKIEDSREDQDKLRQIREEAWRAYFRRPYGNEREGRAAVIMSDSFNEVEATHPSLMRRFLASDDRISIIGDDPVIARGLKAKCREDIHDQGGFRFFGNVLKDGEIAGNGTAKIFWRRIWDKPQEGVAEDVTEEELQGLDADPQFELLEVVEQPKQEQSPIVEEDGTVYAVEPARLFTVKAKFTRLIESGPVLREMPAEEFISEKNKCHINDKRGCGHRRALMAGEIAKENRRLSEAPGKNYYRNLTQAFAASPDSGNDKEQYEKQERMSVHFDPDSVDEEYNFGDGELRKGCEFIEWYDYVASGGQLVCAIITFVNGIVVRVEENEDGIVPLCTWSPFPHPHSIYGTGIASLHADDQKIRTVLYRVVLDQAAFAADPPKYITNRGTDILGLQQIAPGRLVFGRPEDSPPVPMEKIDVRILQLLDYMRTERDERGPSSRQSMGGPESVEKTATEVSIMQRSGMNRVDLIAMTFSELFLVDLYNKMIFLYQKNLDLPIMVEVDGEQIQLTRENIQGNYRARSDLGIEVDFDDREFSKQQALIATMLSVQQLYPYTPETMHEHLKRLYAAAGIREIDRMLPPPEVVKQMTMERLQMAMQQAPQAQQGQETQAPATEGVM